MERVAVMELLRLRVQGRGFCAESDHGARGQGGQGPGDDVAGIIAEAIGEHLKRVKILWERDVREGFGEVYLPEGLARKYPGAGGNGIGNRFSHRVRVRVIRVRARSGGIMCRRRDCNGRSRRARSWLASRSGQAAIRCGIRSRRTCWKMATTSARCRICSATRT